MSNRYGRNDEYVLAGGGNTSYKENGILYVKGSGVALSEIIPEQFVALDIEKLLIMIKPDYHTEMSQAEKEDKALSDMMDARLSGEENKRPSIESVLHAMFPFSFVLHVHPALINGLTCSKNGKQTCKSIFDDKAVWIDLVKPGLELAQTCNREFKANTEKTGKHPQIVILQNHGIFISADTVEEIDGLMEYTVTKLKENIKETPSFDDAPYDSSLADAIEATLKSLYSNDNAATVLFCTNTQVLKYVKDKESFKPVSKSFSPDHIVNCKDEPLFIERQGDGSPVYSLASEALKTTEPSPCLDTQFTAYIKRKGFKPKIVAVQNLGFFALSETKQNAERAKALFLDSIKIATYAKSFGGEIPLNDEFAKFILNWEAEAYRSKQ